MRIWADGNADLARFAERTLFFVGGAPRSGTTWLQQILNSHPDVNCQGEGLFLNQLAGPLEAVMAQRGAALEAKNARLFRHTGGYPLPSPGDTEFLFATAVLLALRRQCAGQEFQAVGEKTPENVFLFPRLQSLFPAARFIAIARDPRDVLTSAWHFFQAPRTGEDDTAAKLGFIRNALPSILEGARVMFEFANLNPTHCMIVTYEQLRRKPDPVVTALFAFLGVSSDASIVADCLARTSFSTMTGGRPAGNAENGSFFRKGVVGDWTSTLTPEMNAMVLAQLGWAFPILGWEP